MLASPHGEFELVFAVPPHRLRALHDVAAALAWSPIRLGSVGMGKGLRIGDTPVDTASVRNLFRESSGDIRRYLEALVALGRGIERASA
jgi:hypothetical protein